MTLKRAIELLKIERACVMRNAGCSPDGVVCDRQCAKCDLVQEDTDLLEMYSFVINKLSREKHAYK